MQQALLCAHEAQKKMEVPIGATLVINDHVIASAYNQTIIECDPTAHAEILVLRQAAKSINNHRLIDATLYVTLEPCLMCVGALIQARIKRLVYATADQRVGALGSVLSVLETKGINHSFSVTEGPLAQESAQLLKTFFLQRRQKKSEE